MRHKLFYGWVVVAACFAVAATFGEAFFSFSVFFKPLENEFGWSRALVSSGFTLFIIGYSISVAVTGRMADRYDPRWLLIPSAVLSGLGVTLCSWVESVDQFRLFMFISGLGSGATLCVPAATVQRWFRNRRSAGTALAIVATGIGVGQLAFTPLINHFILSYGWRQAYLLTGLIFFGTILVASLFIRPSPVAEGPPLTGKESARPASDGGLATGKAMATLAYAAIMFAASVGSMAFQGVTVHLVPYATDLGMESTFAAAALGLIGGVSIVGRLASGFIASWIGWQKTWAFAFLGVAVSVVWLLFVDSTWMMYGFVVLFGIFFGVRVVGQLGILGEFFGLRSVGGLIGITSGISNLVSAGAPFLAGFIFDTTGSYFIAFSILAALLVCASAAIMLMKRPLAK